MPVHAQTNTPIHSWTDLVTMQPQEFPLTPLTCLEGHLPETIQGSLYRNGPALLERAGHRVGHLFDGDGAVLAVHIEAGQAKATYRYIQTEGYQAEEKAQKFLYNGYGMHAPGPFWNRLRRPFKNTANTSVLAVEHKLLALWEGGFPHALNPFTLKTIGIDSLGQLQGSETYSAHPKVDAQTGRIYNFGLNYGKEAQLNLYASNTQGQIEHKKAISLTALGLGHPVSVHDFFLAGDYLVFMIPPVRLNLLPLLSHTKPLNQCMRWQPELGSCILIFDKHTLSLVSHAPAAPWYQWHFGNGCVNAQGEICVDLIRYRNFDSHEYLKDVVSGTVNPIQELDGTLWRMRIDPNTALILSEEEVCHRFGEFPVVDPRVVGQPWQDTYWLMHRKTSRGENVLHGSLGHYNDAQENLMEFDCGEGFYPMEPVVIPKANLTDNWLITPVLNTYAQRSEVWLFEGQALDAGPICRLELPQIIPLGFHGNWRGR